MLKTTLLVICMSFLSTVNLQAKEDFSTRLKKYQQEKNWSIKAAVLIDMANESESINLKELQVYAKEMLEKGIEQNKPAYLNSGRLVYSVILINEGKTEKASNYLKLCELYYGRNENLNLLAIINNHLGHCEYKNGYFKDAIEYYNKAIQLWTVQNNTIETHLSKSFIALSLIQMKQFDKAIEILEKCLEYTLPFKKNRTISSYYSQLGEIYSTLKNKEKARYYYNLGAEFAIKSSDPGTIARAQNYLAISNYYEGNITAAIDLFKSSLEYRIKSGESKLVCESYYNIASLYYETGEYDQAKHFFNLSLKKAKEQNLLQDESDALLELSNTAKKEGDLNSALSFLNEHILVKEKMFNHLKSEQNEEFYVEDLLNQSKLKNQSQLRLVKLTNEIKIERKKFMVLLSISFVTLLSMLFILKRVKKA